MKKYKYKTTEIFIAEAIKTHGDKYDYSLVNYINAKTKINIICPIHGKFEQIPRNHISGQQCQKCSGVFMDKEYFITKANSIHNSKYDYSLVNYVNSLTCVDIICPIHGMFKQKPKHHLNGKECQKCSGKYMDSKYFIELANKIHGVKYSYDLVKYETGKTKIKIICPIHGEFSQLANSHLNGRGCPICKESKGEKIIRLLLKDRDIKFIRQHKFNDCINIKPLLFDFYLPNHNTCIEFNGEQHYKAFKHFGGEDKFLKTKKNDLIKFNYCNANNINLIIINDIKKIKELIINTN
jgi:very-short-patch-repair endonuclease/Zn-finger nucleic acid-binding protein